MDKEQQAMRDHRGASTPIIPSTHRVGPLDKRGMRAAVGVGKVSDGGIVPVAHFAAP